MDGSIAPLREICDLADKYGALVMVDDSHATGFMGAGGRGTPEHCGVAGRIDFLTGTFGKALGGGSGGYTSRQGECDRLACASARVPTCSRTAFRPWSPRSRCARSIWSRTCRELRETLFAHARKFRAGMQAAGFKLLPGEHPDHPRHDRRRRARRRVSPTGCWAKASTSSDSRSRWCRKGEARIRTQMSAGLTDAQLERALAAFIKVGRELELIK